MVGISEVDVDGPAWTKGEASSTFSVEESISSGFEMGLLAIEIIFGESESTLVCAMALYDSTIVCTTVV